MPDRRLELHEILCGILNTRNAYFQPPESVKMNYPAIVYALSNIKSLYANGGVYLSGRQYAVTVIDKNPDSPFVGAVAALQSRQSQSLGFHPVLLKEDANHE